MQYGGRCRGVGDEVEVVVDVLVKHARESCLAD